MERTIISLSIVSALWETYNKDYLDSFVPFFATLLKTKNITEFDNDEISNIIEYFTDEYGLEIPYHPFISIINKCKKYGLINKTLSKYKVKWNKVEEYEFSLEIEKYNNNKKKFVRRLKKYAKENYEIDLEDKDIEDVLLNLMKKNDYNIFNAAKKESIIPELEIPKRYKQYQYLINNFMIFLFENEDPLYRYLSDIAFGHIISSTILHDQYKIKDDTVKGCSIYLDTPIILKLLGSEGTKTAKIYEKHLKEYRDCGAILKIFNHNIDEIYEVLESAREWVEKPNFDPEKANRTTIYFRQENYSETDVQRFINNVDRILKENNIVQEQLPNYDSNHVHQIDEDELTIILEKLLQKNNPGFNSEYYRIRTKRDVDSISGIYRLRKSNKPRYLRQAKNVFVTTNNLLTIANQEYKKKLGLLRNELPACVTDIFVGTILWIKKPKIAKYEYREKFISSCYLSIRPDPVLEKKLFEEANKLLNSKQINKDDYALLTSSHMTHELLGEKTLNENKNFEQKTAFEILESIKYKIRKEVEDEKEELEEKYQKEREEKEILSNDYKEKIEAIKRKAHKQAESNANMNNIIKGTIIWGSIIIPIPLIILNPIFGLISVFSGLVSAYFSFVKGFTFSSNYNEKYIKKYKAILAEYNIEINENYT